MATTRKTTTTRKPTAKAPARKVPADHLPKGGDPAAEMPNFWELPGSEYFKPLNEVSADTALDAIEVLEDSGFKDKDPESLTTRDVRGVMKVVFTEEFIADIDAFRRDFYTAENTDAAAILAVAFFGVLGKGKR